MWTPTVSVREYAIPLFGPGDEYWDRWGDELYMYYVKVAWRGENRWAVLNEFGYCLHKNGTWDHERSPSNRSDTWLRTHRFTLGDALARAEKVAVKERAEVIERWKERGLFDEPQATQGET